MPAESLFPGGDVVVQSGDSLDLDSLGPDTHITQPRVGATADPGPPALPGRPKTQLKVGRHRSVATKLCTGEAGETPATVPAQKVKETIDSRQRRLVAFQLVPYSVIMLGVYMAVVSKIFDMSVGNDVYRGVGATLKSTTPSNCPDGAFSDIAHPNDLWIFTGEALMPLFWEVPTHEEVMEESNPELCMQAPPGAPACEIVAKIIEIPRRGCEEDVDWNKYALCSNRSDCIANKLQQTEAAKDSGFRGSGRRLQSRYLMNGGLDTSPDASSPPSPSPNRTPSAPGDTSPPSSSERGGESSRLTSVKGGKTYNLFNKAVGGIIIGQRYINEVTACPDLYANPELLTHSENVYQNDCHPESTADDFCWEDGSCENGITTAEAVGRSGESAMSQKLLYLNFNDTYDTARRMLSEAAREDSTWISERTADVTIRFVLYNGELAVYSVVDLSLALERGGSTETSISVKSAEVPSWDPGQIVLVTVYLVLLTYHAFASLIQAFCYCKSVFKGGVRQEIRSTSWMRPVIDLAVVVLPIVQLAFVLRVQVQLEDVFDTIASDATKPVTRSDIVESSNRMAEAVTQAEMTRTTSVLVMLCHIVCFFQALSYHPRLSFITSTLEKAWDSLVPFFFVFVIVYVAFAQMGTLLFGSEISQFRTMSRACIELFNMLLGEFEGIWQPMRDVNAHFAALYFWSFYIIMFYVLLNMLLAIILDAYSTVKAEGENASPILRDAQTFGSMYHRRLQKEFSSKGYLEMSRTLAGLASTTHVQQVWDVDGSATNLSFALEGSHKVAARMWQEVDRDRSGSLDATEVWSVLRKIAPHLKETELIKMEAEIRADMDGDNDGQVTEQEFLDWWQNQPVNVQLKLCGGAVMTRDDIIEQLGVPESEARALFSEVQEDVEEVAANSLTQPTTKADLESSVTQIMLMLRGLDERMQRLEAQQNEPDRSTTER